WLDPLVRAWWSRFGLADTVELCTTGRRSGRPRTVLVGLLEVDGRWYVGHPNGPVGWTRNLEAAGRAVVRRAHGEPTEVVSERLGRGPEREAAIRATFVQHPFPADVVYRLAARHIRAVGAFYRLEASPPGGASTVAATVRV
ncbi:MAG TPA: nitroreductase/quinone reductase family protein, partial [Candidatus Dormibacteraeota bacterium]|nr:nitroreductase/quinone reductase family protein [Candidatus Dormibacteraeota bacterium]